MKKISLLSLVGILLSWIMVQPAWAQPASEAVSRELIQRTIHQIYNFEFGPAETNIGQIKAKHPTHPVTPLLSALVLYWRDFPMSSSRPSYTAYNAHLQQALQAAQGLMRQEVTKNEGIFFALTVHGYRSVLASDAGNAMAAMRESKKAFAFMKQGFKRKEQYPEFYLTSGLYNFYVEQYPEDHPMVKPVMWFFPDGNKELGLQQLETAARRGIFTKTEALYYLVYIHHKYRSNPTKALEFSHALVTQHPNNPLFITRHVESLLACGKYQEAQSYVDRLTKRPEKLFLTPAYIFQGVIQEKLHRNLAQAKAYYQKALQLSPYNKKDVAQQTYTKEFYALAYAGLGRIAAQEGQSETARHYYKKSLDLGEYKSTVREAKAYLSS